MVEHCAVGAPAAPWHSRIVTLADPPLWVIVLTTVTWQMRPRPGVSSTPLLHVVVAATVAALAVAAVPTDIAMTMAMARRARETREIA